MNVRLQPAIQSFTLEGVKHITPNDAHKALQNGEAVLLDIREDYECAVETIDVDNVVFVPMSVIMQNINKIPDNQPLIVVCKEGIRSAKVVNLLHRQRFEDVYNLDGGMFAWKKQKLPLDSIFGGDGCLDCHGDCSKC